MEISNQILSEITVYMKYAKYLPELNRRESWEELVTRLVSLTSTVDGQKRWLLIVNKMFNF